VAANKQIRLGPVAIANAAGNLFNPPTLTGGVNTPGTTVNTYYVLRHIRVVNKTAGAATVSLYIGATGASAAGTEFAFNATSVPANSAVDHYGFTTLDINDFLTGLASAAATLTIEAEGEIGIR
jgi:hypothetical protein